MQPVPQLESVVLAQCKGLLRPLRHQKKLTFRRVTTTGIPRGYRGGRMDFSRNKEGEGLPDLIVIIPFGVTLWVETKSSKGVLSDSQKTFKEEVEALGHKYFLVREVSQLETILQTFGIETRTWVK